MTGVKGKQGVCLCIEPGAHSPIAEDGKLVTTAGKQLVTTDFT